ncbi:phosphonate ABC transporter [Vandammella animalimorsus]|uniref:Phosphonate ABC transporter n=1 Tax=Vandammella animalimorsus TaxID=2029117 RepID=A0A2A2ARJ6_9BURK|nr:ATP-binding cassette domain-containing protein [Vandammella animalimorsus]PAT40377.1 phosphonate ABC transporter [Vandammella animalimorsus]
MTAAPQAPAAQAQAAALALRDASIAPAGAAQPLLCGLRLQIAPGEQVALIGASGSGKSTLMLALAGAWPLQAGALHWHGQDPWQLPRSQRQRLRREMFYAPQVPPLPPRQRVVAAVLAGRLPHMGLAASLRTLWHPRRADAQWAQQALLALDLPDKLWQRVDRLSGGERQRVGLARLLASQARCWLVDEPLSALDPSRAQQVMQVLRQTARQRGNTLLCSLHQVDAARRFARVLALKDGAIAYDGPGSGLSDALLLQLYGSTALDDAPADVQADVQAEIAPAHSPIWAGPAHCG